MSYLNNSTVVVDAVLTKKGREILASQGGLNISSYALSDDEIDYRLYQPDHPQGSAFYDLAVKNIPVMESFTDETQVLKFKLVTLASGVSSIPVISLGQTSINVSSDFRGEVVIVPSTNPVFNTTLGYTAVLGDKNVGTIVGEQLETAISATIPSFIGDVTSTTAQVALGIRFRFIPNSSLSATTTTRLTVIGNESGGAISIPVTVNVR